MASINAWVDSFHDKCHILFVNNVNLTPAKKLALAESLYHSAKALKAAYFKKIHPDWSEEKIKAEVNKWMMYAKS